MVDQTNVFRKMSWRAGVWALSVLLLTTVHHVWGAIVFDTFWRLDVLSIVVPTVIIITMALWLGQRARHATLARFFTWIAATVILLVPVALIGIGEGGYNHLMKNIVYFAAGEAATMQLFPPPLFYEHEIEMPNDIFFEVTGVLQFPLGLAAGIATIALLGTLRRTNSAETGSQNHRKTYDGPLPCCVVSPYRGFDRDVLRLGDRGCCALASKRCAVGSTPLG